MFVELFIYVLISTIFYIKYITVLSLINTNLILIDKSLNADIMTFLSTYAALDLHRNSSCIIQM